MNNPYHPDPLAAAASQLVASGDAKDTPEARTLAAKLVTAGALDVSGDVPTWTPTHPQTRALAPLLATRMFGPPDVRIDDVPIGEERARIQAELETHKNTAKELDDDEARYNRAARVARLLARLAELGEAERAAASQLVEDALTRPRERLAELDASTPRNDAERMARASERAALVTQMARARSGGAL